VKEIESLVKDEDAKVFVLNYEEAAYTGKRYGMEKYYPTWKWPEDCAAVQAGVRAYQALFGEPPRIGKWTFSTNAVTISGVYGIPAVVSAPDRRPWPTRPTKRPRSRTW